MKVRFSPEFLHKLKASDVRLRDQFKRRIILFCRRPNELILRNHALKKDWGGYRSINITGDIRAIYTEKMDGRSKIAYFVAVGTHRELYSQNMDE